jgi:lysophospholipase L1-like esterase
MRIPVFFSLVLLAAATGLAQPQPHPFENEIRAFEAGDRTNPPPKNAILFIGSSSIRMWKTVAQDFPEYRVINRGFGGSQISNSIHFAERIVIPYEPSVIVFYAGGNDINAGKSAVTVFDDFKTFVSTVRAKLPATRVAYISIAGNPARWAQVERVREANRLIRDYTRTQAGLSFIDVFPHMLGDDGQPKPDIFLDDKLHMNGRGYAIWKRVVGEHLKTLVSADAPAAKQ